MGGPVPDQHTQLSRMLTDRLLHVWLIPVDSASADVSVVLLAGNMIFEGRSRHEV